MRVLVCREARDGAETAQRLARIGHEAVLAPVLAIVPLAVELPPDRPDAVLFTSAHAAETLAEEQARWLAVRPLYAVGDRTAAAARQRGFKDVRVGQGDAASLASLLALTLPAPARLLYLAGRVRKPDLEQTLGRGGYAVAVVEGYDVEAAAPWGEAIQGALAAGTIDACLHFSARSAGLALDFATQARVRGEFAALRHLCISRDVAELLLGHGLPMVEAAARPSEAGLFEALAKPRA